MTDSLFDFYANFRIEEKQRKDVDNLVEGSGKKYAEINDVLSRILLLSTVFGLEENFPYRQREIDPKVYAKVGERNDPSGLKAILHSKKIYDKHLKKQLAMLNTLGLIPSPDISSLPRGSWFLKFPITLSELFISRDDVPLYIVDNPIRKDKVFGVPFTSAKGWKGNLRWTMMKVHLEPIASNTKKFAEVRYQHTLLFGTEKGMETPPTGWTRYLDALCNDPENSYRKLLCKGEEEASNLKGMLFFFPTFWNKVDLEVINPHDRETKAGTIPIYIETVSKGSEGLFKLLYVPLHRLGLSEEEEFRKKVFDDLHAVVLGLKEMMLTYGFSAKKSIGYGVIEDSWDKNKSKLEINGLLEVPFQFSNFEELEEGIGGIKEG